MYSTVYGVYTSVRVAWTGWMDQHQHQLLPKSMARTSKELLWVG